ncbi:unnamed protein product [Mycena citricolor]|uniref:Uncharacterized protein n=1 Tax=Mycena citricolor TaxID=2018698 RepID=A0AAD2HFP1_9AGAR|nr:unnamed protein product [Mycena citricolor]CAK5273935.1 unnamed protein product [Mycena citricolor]CAK5281852.1 unnamed protein product [Mycena citricolor]
MFATATSISARSPAAFMRENSSGVAMPWTWKARVCIKVLKCFPIRLFLYCIMYAARMGGTLRPLKSVDWSRIANVFHDSEKDCMQQLDGCILRWIKAKKIKQWQYLPPLAGERLISLT